MLFTSITITYLLPFLLFSDIFAFYKQGHKLIGKIVDNILNEKTKKNIGLSIEDISPWADSIRWNNNYTWARPLHYIDTNDNPEKNECYVNSFKTIKPNIYDALTNYTTRLLDIKNRNDEDLKFLIHFYEDLFQPLHVSGSYRGGNSFDTIFFGRKSNLHQVWDYLILRDRNNEISNYIDYLINSTKFVTPYESFNYQFWIQYNNKINCEYVYRNLDNKISIEYYNKNKYILEKQILQASVNMKYMLESLFT